MVYADSFEENQSSLSERGNYLFSFENPIFVRCQGGITAKGSIPLQTWVDKISQNYYGVDKENGGYYKVKMVKDGAFFPDFTAEEARRMGGQVEKIEGVSDYKLNIVANNLNAIDSKLVGRLINAWLKKTNGTVNIGGISNIASNFAGHSSITAKNTQDFIINSTELNRENGNLIVSFNNLSSKATEKKGRFEIPFVNSVSSEYLKKVNIAGK